MKHNTCQLHDQLRLTHIKNTHTRTHSHMYGYINTQRRVPVSCMTNSDSDLHRENLCSKFWRDSACNRPVCLLKKISIKPHNSFFYSNLTMCLNARTLFGPPKRIYIYIYIYIYVYIYMNTSWQIAHCCECTDTVMPPDAHIYIYIYICIYIYEYVIVVSSRL